MNYTIVIYANSRTGRVVEEALVRSFASAGAAQAYASGVAEYYSEQLGRTHLYICLPTL